MLTVFQLLLSLVTRQRETDQHSTTNEPAQDNQLELTHDQSENTGENRTVSIEQSELDLGERVPTPAPKDSVDEVTEESKPPDVADREPVVVETVNAETEVSQSQADVGQTKASGQMLSQPNQRQATCRQTAVAPRAQIF